MSELPNLPKSISRVIEHAVAKLSPNKILLYGSQARCDATPTSDYDIAFDFSANNRKNWHHFLCDIQELPISLQSLDLVSLVDASPDLRARIIKEGVTLYERK